MLKNRWEGYIPQNNARAWVNTGISFAWNS